MRIIQVIPDFGLGGIQKAGCVLAAGMVARGHETLLIAEQGGPRFDPCIDYHRVMPGPQLQVLSEIASRFQPHVIHIHAHTYPEDLILALADRLGSRVTLVTTPVFGRPPQERRVLDCTRTCGVGAFTFYRLGRWLNQEAAQMIRSGIAYVPLTPFQPPSMPLDRDEQRHNLGIASDTFVFGRIGRSEGGKWHPCYRDIIDQVLGNCSGAHWLSIGFPEELGRGEMERRWGGRFRDFPQTADYQFLAGILSAMDVQVFWSQNGECFASTICEAAGMGTPTVAGANPCQDNGQAEQVLDGVTGWLVGTVPQAVRILISLCADPSRLPALRASTQRYAHDRWHADRVTGDLLQLYDYWQTGQPCEYLDVMRREHAAFAKNYARRIAGIKADDGLHYCAWRSALWMADSWTLFSLGRRMKPYARRMLARL